MYALFAGQTRTPSGGWGDHRQSSADIEALTARAVASQDPASPERAEWWHIVDLTRGAIQARWPTEPAPAIAAVTPRKRPAWESAPKSRICRATPAEPVIATDLVGCEILEISMRCGTYGQGGPGFAGFRIGKDRWLILCLWSSASWLQIDGRPIEASLNRSGENARFDPIIPDDVLFGRDPSRTDRDCLAAALPLPATITEFAFSGHHGHMIAGGHRIAIAAEPTERPVTAGSGETLRFLPDDDVAQAWILAPFPWVEI